MNKKCSKCHQEKDIKDFCKAGKNRPGKYKSYCKECQKIFNQNWVAKQRMLGKRKDFAKLRQEELDLFSVGKKKCTKCLKIKTIDCFHLDKTKRTGFSCSCKECTEAFRKTPEQTEKIKAYSAKEETKKRQLEKSRRPKDKKRQSNYQKTYLSNPEVKARRKAYFQKEETKINRRAYNKKLRENPVFRLNQSVSGGVWKTLIFAGKKRKRRWENLVGYTIDQLKQHLEKQFQQGMSWENYGRKGWHIDHIIPITAFNITSAECEDFYKCWALENLRPLWAIDNIRKGGLNRSKLRCPALRFLLDETFQTQNDEVLSVDTPLQEDSSSGKETQIFSPEDWKDLSLYQKKT